MNPRTWRDDVDLSETKTWLLEASAGTGKTFQIAGLFVRLVAEYGLKVESILAITFTKAAAAELRDRIRLRLRDCLAALQDPTLPRTDPVIAYLCARDDGATMKGRIEIALRSFDVAPISTIHGFAQRMLEEFAFDSGQDANLELLQEPAEIIERIVDDSLATLYSKASAEEIGLLQRSGVSRDNLIATAKAMTGAAEPRVVPEGNDSDLEGSLPAARAWLDRVEAMRRYVDSPETNEAIAALEADIAKRCFHNWRQTYPATDRKQLSEWLDCGALDNPDKLFKRLRVEKLRDYKHDNLETRPYWAIALGIESFCEAQHAFMQSFAPLAGFARAVRARVETEIERRRSLTFSGMLSRLAERVDKDGGAKSPIAMRIRERFDAAFVDEFQDTDLVQWRVIEAAFHGHRRLFLIGDPKQAIYGFRGADVHVYLKAAQAVEEGQRYTMEDNWRSDPAAVYANNHLWRAGSGAFDQDPIDYIQVKPQKSARLAPPGAGLELRWVDARAKGGGPGEPIGAKDPRLVAQMVALEAAAWLRGDRGQLIGEGGPRRVMPADLAVLVNAHYEAQEVRAALDRVGIRAIAASKDSVFQTDVAGWLAHWLDAVAGAGRDRSSRTALVTPLFGWTADDLAWALEHARPDVESAEGAPRQGRDFTVWTDRLRAASERWQRRGFAGTFDHEAMELAVYERVLALPSGERHATDLRHLFELCHAEERSRRLGPAALAEWLRAQGSEDKPTRGDEVVQRLESDADAVTIETVHASKGLEYPIVLLPFGWSARAYREKGQPLGVQGEAGFELNLDRPKTEGRALAVTRHSEEQRREDLRKLYVALTRAKHCTIAWYGPIGDEGADTSATALGRLLMRSPSVHGYAELLPVFESAKKAAKSAAPDAWTIARERLNELARRSEGSTTWVAEERPERIAPLDLDEASTQSAPRAAAWPSDRERIDGPWQVTSFTRINGALDRNEKLGAYPIEQDAAPTGGASTGFRAPDKPDLDPSFASLPRLSKGSGTEYGTWVHGVLEDLDFATIAAKDGRSLAALIASKKPSMQGSDAAAEELEAQLPKLLTTPLGSDDTARDRTLGVPAGFTLSQLTRADRLDELEFDLRLGDGTGWRRAGSGPSGAVDPQRVYDAILSHEALAHGHPLWLERLRAQRERGLELIGEVVGILNGSIDLTFRIGERYFLADYKTNRLGSSEPGHYAQAWLEWEMTKASYALQSLIYTVALHRHLCTRLRGYDYDAHMGGYLYLFLRGMSGAETPRDPASGRCLGVFGGRWPKALVLDFDEALSPPNAAGES